MDHAESRKLSESARALIGKPDNELTFSAVSLWEIAIKTGRGRDDFRIDAACFVGSCSTTATPNSRDPAPMRPRSASLPPIHKDPFDRMLVAQTMIEGLTLLTADPVVAKYPGDIRLA